MVGQDQNRVVDKGRENAMGTEDTKVKVVYEIAEPLSWEYTRKRKTFANREAFSAWYDQNWANIRILDIR